MQTPEAPLAEGQRQVSRQGLPAGTYALKLKYAPRLHRRVDHAEELVEDDWVLLEPLRQHDNHGHHHETRAQPR